MGRQHVGGGNRGRMGVAQKFVPATCAQKSAVDKGVIFLPPCNLFTRRYTSSNGQISANFS